MTKIKQVAMPLFLTILGACASTHTPTTSVAQTASIAQTDSLKGLVEQVSALTGDQYSYGNWLDNRHVGLTPNFVLTKENASQVLTNALLMNELTRVPTGTPNMYFVVEARQASMQPLPVFEASLKEEAKLPNTFDIVNLKYKTMDPQMADVLQRFLTDLIPRWGRITSYPDTGVLVITDSAQNIKRIVEILKSVDKPLSAKFKKELEERRKTRQAAPTTKKAE